MRKAPANRASGARAIEHEGRRRHKASRPAERETPGDRILVTAGRNVPVAGGSQVHAAVAAATSTAMAAGLGARDVARCELLATELATNLAKFAFGGRMLITVPAPAVVQLVAVDSGPGIDDVPASMTDGYTTTTSLGGGLGACRRAAARFDLYSLPGRGTVVLARVGRRGAERTGPADVGGILTPHPAETVSGDGYAMAWQGHRLTVGVADGLGHGAAAAEASRAALEEIGRRPGADVAALLTTLDTRLRGTRGAAVAIAHVDAWTGRLSTGGVGNVTGRLVHDGECRTVLSEPGILGAGAPSRPHPPLAVSWTDRTSFVLHTDGINGRWQPGSYPGAERHHPAVTAALLWRDANRGNDDAAVVVIRAPEESR